jgi:hypothetical protein
MSYTAVPVPTVSTGDVWTATNHNTYILTNFAHGVPGAFQAKGDLYCGVGVDTGTILPVGINGSKLHQLVSAPSGTGFVWGTDAPGAEIVADGPQSIPNNVATGLTFDSLQWDVGGYSGLPGPITVPVGEYGLYICSARLYFAGHATANKYREMYILVTGSGQTFFNSTVNAIGGLDTWLNVTVVCALIASDQISLVARQISGGALNVWQKRLSVVKVT